VDLGLGHDLDQRHTGAIEIDFGKCTVGLVNQFAGILFHMDTDQLNRL